MAILSLSQVPQAIAKIMETAAANEWGCNQILQARGLSPDSIEC